MMAPVESRSNEKSERMSLETFNREIYKNGFCLVKKCISLDLLEEAKQVLLSTLMKINGAKCDFEEGMGRATQTHRLSDIQNAMQNDLQHSGIRKRLHLEPAILEKFIHLIGPDLAYLRAGQIAINMKEQSDNLYFKKWHQEMWSGAGVNEVLLWNPILMEPGIGGVEFIPGSHMWGLVPNRNREPLELPPNYQIVHPYVEEGDAVFFTALTLHRTVLNTNNKPRIALATAIRNIYHPSSGLESMLSWMPFHFSAFAKIRKGLGNPYLTPFRTLGGILTNRDDGKIDIPGLEEFSL